MNRSKMTRNSILIVFLCFVMSTFVSLWSLRIMARNNMEGLIKALTARIYDPIAGQLSEPVIVSRTMANDRFLIDLLESEDERDPEETEALMQAYLLKLREGLKYESAFVVSDRSHRYYTFEGLVKEISRENISRDQWYFEFIGQDDAYSLDVDRDEFGADAWTVFVDTRIEDDDGNLL
ncbi:MAG: GGDEF domain-containing protein, partial [Clostridia bacterium]|nr:GGDEF domain-containing protein [Clostridia bacterium]